MIFAALFVAGIVVVASLIVRASRRGWPPAPAWRSGLRVGVFIAVARLTVLWAVFLWAGDVSDWRQVAGYVALVLNTIVELVVARVWLDDPAAWRMVLTVLVIMTSLGLGQVIAYLASRMQTSSRGAVQQTVGANGGRVQGFCSVSPAAASAPKLNGEALGDMEKR